MLVQHCVSGGAGCVNQYLTMSHHSNELWCG